VADFNDFVESNCPGCKGLQIIKDQSSSNLQRNSSCLQLANLAKCILVHLLKFLAAHKDSKDLFLALWFVYRIALLKHGFRTHFFMDGVNG